MTDSSVSIPAAHQGFERGRSNRSIRLTDLILMPVPVVQIVQPIITAENLFKTFKPFNRPVESRAIFHRAPFKALNDGHAPASRARSYQGARRGDPGAPPHRRDSISMRTNYSGKRCGEIICRFSR